jgi:L-alanine-DL-glutamate epimerase-like enolase superfamily enzyme
VRIASIEAIPLAYPEPNDHGLERYLLLTKVTTDEGVVGWGEAWTRWPEATLACIDLVDGMAAVVIGEDPFTSEVLWNRLRRHSYWYGTGGLAAFAISAIDTALWDIKGKVTNQSLVSMLGGAVQERLPAIASSHPSKPDLAEGAAEIAEWLEAGNLHGVKFGLTWEGEAGLGREHDRDVEFVRLVREAIGPHRDIMVDVRGAFPWDLGTATRRVRAFEEYGLRWIEEPFDPNALELYRELRGRVTTLVAFGERARTVEEFQAAVQSGLTDVVGVDPGSSEGLTGAVKVIERIEAAQRHFNAHAWSGAIVSAASVALSAATRSSLVFEVKPRRNPMQHELVAEPIEPVDGWMTPPSRPGVGAEILDDCVEHYRMDR